MKKALVVVDMQADFVTGALGTKEAEAIVPNVRRKLEEEQAQGTKIIFTKDTHEEDYLDTQEGRKLPVRHCIRDTEGWEIISELAEFAECSVVLEKPSFGSVNLPEYMKDADIIEVIGLCTDICVITNVLLLKTHFPEKQILVDASCCAGVTVESHQNAIEAMKMCQIDIAMEEEKPLQKCVVVQTFGNFEVFVDDKPVQFSRSKSKELFAFLIDRRGAGVSTAEIASILFEDKEYNRSIKNQVQTIISQLMEGLRAYGVEDIIVRQWNSIAVVPHKVKCDYFDFLEHKNNDMMGYSGEYMINYSWAEYTNGYLMHQKGGENGRDFL